ncbi:fasciclin domain-containing protein [Flavobacterium sp.]|uniref:fasciclin domain-containing protein n=1 Tax=Flavobacterium sp. TaxID=239 RepID=UPI003342D38C
MAFAQSEKTVNVGGAPRYPSKNIVQNALNSKEHTTLVGAVKATSLFDVLQSAGPFTVFAPTNATFDKLPAGTVVYLLKLENLEKLQTVLKFHVVAGKFSVEELMNLVKKGKGKATLKTVSGGELTVTQKGNALSVSDRNGNVATVTIGNVFQSNGVIHVVDTVVLP